MNFRLVDWCWNEVLEDAFNSESSSVRIVCPFIKKGVVERLLRRRQPRELQVITRFNLGDFAEGVSDASALRWLLENGAQIRGIRNLHAKVYLFGASRVVVTSANLTDAAMYRNHEFGFDADDADIASRCRDYFDELWQRGGHNLSIARLEEWERLLTEYLAAGAPPVAATNLPDEGADGGAHLEPIAFSAWVDDLRQGFVKFFGESKNRAQHTIQVLDEVRGSGCHWACTYGKRPKQVRDGALMFMGRLVQDPNDILIYGRAVGMTHDPGRDDASLADIQRRPWKERWPYYVRVHHAEFVAGSLSNGISLGQLMDELGANAFASTQRNAAKGQGNTDPRRAFMQQPAVQLSQQGMEWLNRRFEIALSQHGKLAPAELAQLDWP
jgi:hypothetical protein